MPQTCVVYRLGLVLYEQAWQYQEQLAAQIAGGEHPPALLLLEHLPVFTIGRGGRAENLLWDQQELDRRGVSLLWVDRGGDVTCHAPGQLVGYPLLPLAPGGLYASQNAEDQGQAGSRLPQADYIGYLRKLEQTLIQALGRFSVTGVQIPGLTGVWVEPERRFVRQDSAPEPPGPAAKIAAIGVKVDARGVSRHGFALNVDMDMSYWQGIVACGLKDRPLANLAELRSPPPTMEDVMAAVISAFGEVFGYQMIERPG